MEIEIPEAADPNIASGEDYIQIREHLNAIQTENSLNLLMMQQSEQHDKD